MAKGQAVAQRDPQQELVLSRVSDSMLKIPEAGGDGLGMVTDILDAASANVLIGDDSNSLPQLETFFGHDIRVDSVSRVKSDFNEPGQITDQYLVVSGHDLTTNEACMFSVGATTPILKLIKLYEFGAFPATCRFSQSSKPTNQGYYPVNMSVLTVTDRTTVDA